jgi:hypothetical protein
LGLKDSQRNEASKLYPTSTGQTNLLSEIVRLRTLVLALGESSEPPWWKTKYVSSVGFRFLERVYPRSFLKAALNASGKAARAIHDQSVGKVAVYHLFRLPPGLEAELQQFQPKLSAEELSELHETVGNRSLLLDKLKEISNNAPYIDDLGGAIKIGPEPDCYNLYSYERMASIYHSVFSEGKKAFPYFSDERNR